MSGENPKEEEKVTRSKYIYSLIKYERHARSIDACIIIIIIPYAYLCRYVFNKYVHRQLKLKLPAHFVPRRISHQPDLCIK